MQKNQTNRQDITIHITIITMKINNKYLEVGKWDADSRFTLPYIAEIR